MQKTKPYPCGYFGSPQRSCICSPQQINNYLRRISGPLLDRIDLQVSVEAVDPKQLRQRIHGESSRYIRDRVMSARLIQQNRLKNCDIHSNGQLRSHEVKEFCSLNDQAEDLFTRAIDQLKLSARAHDRILKVARTIADLAENHLIESIHIAEAIQYRQLDRVWAQGTTH